MPTKSWAGSRKLTATLQRSCDGLALGAAPHASSGHNCRQFQGKLTGRRQKLSTARRLCLSSAARANVLDQVIQHRCAATDAAFTPCQKAYRRGQEPLRGCSSRSHQWRHSHRWGTAASCQPAQSPEYDGHNLREPGLAFCRGSCSSQVSVSVAAACPSWLQQQLRTEAMLDQASAFAPSEAYSTGVDCFTNATSPAIQQHNAHVKTRYTCSTLMRVGGRSTTVPAREKQGLLQCKRLREVLAFSPCCRTTRCTCNSPASSMRHRREPA
jgi:hypothetical protein